MGNKHKKNKDAALEEQIQDVTLEDPTTPQPAPEAELTYEEKLQYVNAIAKPMATKSQARKLYKLMKKATKEKGYLRAGLRDVQKRIRLGETGLVVFAGDVSPIEIMCHMPLVCEDKGIPYCYTPSYKDIGSALGVKRGSIMVLIRPHDNYMQTYKECEEELKALPIPTDGETQIRQDKLK